MKRRDFLSGAVASAALSGPALAQDYVKSVIAQLSEMGFRSIRQERTLLGRVRITGSRSDGRREIIINPNNGEILRDLWTPVQGELRAPDIIADKSGGGGGKGSPNGDDEDGGDDDEDDEDDDEDSEGGSGGNSGSGGSGSGNDDESGGDDEGDDEGGN